LRLEWNAGARGPDCHILFPPVALAGVGGTVSKVRFHAAFAAL
jgi:hypothetical protein